jgi:hypothetical protein
MDITINELERNAADDTVVTAHWDATLKDGVHTARAYGSQSFARNADSPTFIAFADLTEADVVGWLTLDAEIEASLIASIAEQKAPVRITGMPWH